MSDNYMNYSNAEEIFGGYAQSINKIKPTPITYAAYQALSAEEKAAKRYRITDYPTAGENYNSLLNRPQINSVTLAGNKTAHDLGLVAAETGKGLSSNDYTAAEKTKLAGLENYDDTQLANRVSDIEGVIPNNATTLNKLATTDDMPDTTNFIEKSVTVGFVKNDGTIDTHTYVQSSDLGTAAGKDYTDRVAPNNRNLVESQSVYSAIQSALSSIYTPRGDLTCAELTSSLLVAANVGDVYEMTDAGTTSALFLQGAGETIAVGSNVGIINAGEGRILFNLMPGAFDLTDYQKKELDDLLTIGGVSHTEVEPALGALNTAKADKSEMSVTAGTGADADKTVIQLKSGTTATVLHAHQDISGKVDKSATAGLLKNDGTVDTNTYMTSSDIAGKADKSEMSIVNGTGASADKTTIILKSGTSATVLKEHQDISGKAEKSEMSVTPGTGDNADKTTIQLKEGTSATVLTAHQDLSGKVDKVSDAMNGNFAGLNASGEVVDSGKKASDFSTPSDIQNIYEVMGKNGAKNLVNYPFTMTTKTVNGITFTDNGDGTVTVNGTATDTAFFNFHSRLINDINPLILENGSYILTGCPSNGSSTTYFLRAGVTKNSVHSLLGDDYGNGRDIEVNGDDYSQENAHVQVQIIIISGQTVSNLIFKPMIRYAEDTDSTYVPYAMTNQQITPYVQAISNPNLLDNPWFTVNQRGQTQYDGWNAYSLDRWRRSSSRTIINLISNGITVSSSEGADNYSFVHQIIEDTLYQSLHNKMITISVMYSDGHVEYASGRVDTTASSTTIFAQTASYQNSWVKFEHSINETFTNSFFIVTDYPNKSTSIRAVKLELGSVSTLAMDIAPNCQQELAKCQRYYIGGAMESMYLAKTGNDYVCFIPTPVTMRAIPSIVGEPQAYSVSSNTRLPDAVISLFGSSAMPNGVALKIGGVSEPCIVVFNNTSMGLSADL